MKKLFLALTLIFSISSLLAWENFDEPTKKELKKSKLFSLWGTSYYTPSYEKVPDGKYHLLSMTSDSLGPTLSQQQLCNIGLQGAASFVDSLGNRETFTVAGYGKKMQVNCSKYFNFPMTGRLRYQKAKGPYGDGAYGHILVPFRTVAVDPKVFRSGTVLYIPAAKGIEITLDDGSVITHDGYFFAGDVGGGIKGNHIDMFVGGEFFQVFAKFAKSTAAKRFKAYVIKNKTIIDALKEEHRPKDEDSSNE